MLVGDSIREGYYPHLKADMNGIAEVLTMPDNCRFTAYTMFHVREWLDAIGNNADIIVWNNGLWDVVHIHDAEYTVTEIGEYTRNLECIIGQMRAAIPNAKIVWASTTAVIESENRRNRPDHIRFNSQICEFNRAAMQVMNKNEITVCDLNAVSQTLPSELYLDGVHFKPEGYAHYSKALAFC